METTGQSRLGMIPDQGILGRYVLLVRPSGMVRRVQCKLLQIGSVFRFATNAGALVEGGVDRERDWTGIIPILRGVLAVTVVFDAP